MPSGVSIRKTTNGRGDIRWELRLGKRWTRSNVVRLNYSTHREAMDVWRREAQSRKQHGLQALDPDHYADAVTALSMLPNGISLVDIASEWVRRNQWKEKTVSHEEAMKAFLKHLQNRHSAPKTIEGYQTYVKRLAEVLGPSTALTEASSDKISNWIRSYQNASSQDIIWRTLSSFYAWAAQRGWIETNPMSEVTRPKVILEEIHILTTAQSQTLLEAAREQAGSPVLAYVAIGLFAGLRAAELSLLDWDDIDLDQRTILVKAANSKTRRRRVVTVSDNLSVWLKKAPRTKIVPESCFREHFEAVREGAGLLQEWPRNALRHSFGSYHFAQHKNENLTASEMGNSPAMIYRHYRALVTPKDAKAFWSLGLSRAKAC